MRPDFEIADLRRRLANNGVLLQQLTELRSRLLNRRVDSAPADQIQALRINEETILAVWQAVRLARMRLAELEPIAMLDPQTEAPRIRRLHRPPLSGGAAHRRRLVSCRSAAFQ